MESLSNGTDEVRRNDVESGDTEYGSLSLRRFSNNDNFVPKVYETDVAYEFGKESRQIDERVSQRRPRRMSVGEQARLDTVTRFGSWLEELQREAAFSVDVSDQHIVRQAMNKAQVLYFFDF